MSEAVNEHKFAVLLLFAEVDAKLHRYGVVVDKRLGKGYQVREMAI